MPQRFFGDARYVIPVVPVTSSSLGEIYNFSSMPGMLFRGGRNEPLTKSEVPRVSRINVIRFLVYPRLVFNSTCSRLPSNSHYGPPYGNH